MSDATISTIYADTLYDGIDVKPRHNVLIRIADGKISSLSYDVPPADFSAETLRAPIVTPGLIDLQINGAGDVQFNFDLTVAGLQKMVDASALGGAAYIFPTFTTAPGNDYRKAVAAIIAAQNEGLTGIAGIHLEGPFISTERPGIHRPEFIRTLTAEDVDYLCAVAMGLTIILTLAPEQQDPALLKRLSDMGIILFAGHSNATFDEMKVASEAGFIGATHLFNAMSQSTVRQPGVVGAVLVSSDLYAGIIADGHHVHATNLKIAARLLPNRLCLVTDAMQTMNGSSESFELYGKTITLKDGILTGPNGILGGAHLSLMEAVENMVKLTGIGLSDAIRMASGNPARAVGLDDHLGTISVGMAASMSLFSKDLQCSGVLRKGAYFTCS